jgi:signal transduction histidine kinase
VVALLSTLQSLPDDERAALERALVPLARRAAIGALAADVAHDAGNALFGVIGLLELTLDDEPLGRDRRELLSSSSRELDRTLRPFLHFARTGDDEGSRSDLAELVRDAVSLYRHGLRKVEPLAVDVPGEPVRVAVPPSLAGQAVVHLLLAADLAASVELADGVVRVAPVREPSLDELVAARIAADHGGSLTREGGAYALRLPPA